VAKIQAADFTPEHRENLEQARFRSGEMVLPDVRWAAQFLGAGEEKAVFCVCDHAQRVFAVEVLGERTYLNGRFAGGQYFFDMHLPALSRVRLNPDTEFGLIFSGKVKIREFVHGYEWSRFRFDPRRASPLDGVLTAYLRSMLMTQFTDYKARYKDVHERNVLFELRTVKEKGVPLLARSWKGGTRLVKVGLQPIDVR
jgi:hypothetical protein